MLNGGRHLQFLLSDREGPNTVPQTAGLVPYLCLWTLKANHFLNLLLKLAQCAHFSLPQVHWENYYGHRAKTRHILLYKETNRSIFFAITFFILPSIIKAWACSRSKVTKAMYLQYEMKQWILYNGYRECYEQATRSSFQHTITGIQTGRRYFTREGLRRNSEGKKTTTTKNKIHNKTPSVSQLC